MRPQLVVKSKKVAAAVVVSLGLLFAGLMGSPRGMSSVIAASPVPQNTRTEKVIDPANNETAFTVQVPQGWSFVGTILRPGGCHAPAVPADGLSFSAVAPDHVTAAMQLPGSYWDWASDGSSPRGAKCKTLNINSAVSFLLNIVIVNVHPSAQILGIVPLSPQMKAGVEAAQRNLAAKATNTTRNTMDTGSVRIEYNLNGQIVDEQLGTVVTCMEVNFPAYPQMRRPARLQRTCQSHGIYVKRALKGHLDELVERHLQNPNLDQQWDAHISEQMRQAFAAYQKASNDQFASIQQHYREVTAGMIQRGKEINDNLAASTRSAMNADNQKTAAMQHAAHLQVLDSLNRQDFIDPETGPEDRDFKSVRA